MPEIIFTCSQCKASLSSDTAHLGQMTTCPSCSAPVMISINTIYPGLEIGGFVLERPLGKGGMGEVWLAYHTAMERKVAFKMLSLNLTNDPEFVGRFFREVKNSAKLEHPNIVTAFDAGTDKGFYFLAMTYVDGVDLETRISRDRSIPEDEALRIIRDIAKALDYAWNEFKLLHCDIKPSNIMIDGRGKVRLMDMGLSKCVAGDSSLTMAGGIMGTPHYVSPEQARGSKDIDFRSDVYSLGATFYHIVTGHTPYEAETPMGIVTQHITDPLIPANRRNPELTAPCSALIDIMMAKNPEERGKSWKEVIKNIDAAIGGKLPRKTFSVAKAALKPQAEQQNSGKIPRQDSSSRPVKSTSGSNKVFVIIAVIFIFAAVILGVALLQKKPKNQTGVLPVQSNQGVPEIKPAPAATPVFTPKPPTAVNTMPPVKKNHGNKEMWDEALAFAQDNPDDAEKVLDKLRQAKAKLAGSEYESLADQEIMKMVNAQLKVEIPTAAVTAAPDIPEEKPLPVAAVPVKAKDDEAIRNKFNEFADSIVSLLVDNKYEDAATAVKKASGSDEYLGFENSLGNACINTDSLLEIDKTVISSFEPDIGREVQVDTLDGKRKIIVREIKGDRLSIEEKTGGLSAKMELPIKKLTEGEKLKRTAAMPVEARNIYAGLIALKQQRDYSKACDFLENTGTLSGAFLRYISRLQKEKTDSEAKDEILKLLGKAGLKGRSLNTDDVKTELASKNYPADKIESILAALADYDAEKELSNLLYGAGLRTLTANQDKIKTELTRKKMSASELEKFQKSVATYREKYRDTKFLREKGQFLDTLLDGAGNTYGMQFDKPLSIGGGLNMLLVPVSPGEFRMGGANSEISVKLTKPFWIGKYEVTQAQYEKIMGKNPSAYKIFNAPVERVSWNDAQEFCRLLTEREFKKKTIPEGYVYRLPTEAEWEYCCLAGTDTMFSFGDSTEELFKYGNYCDKSNTNNLAHQDRKHDDGSDKTSVVGKYQPNAWGICDMHGNVWEWCLDRYGDIKGNNLENPIGCESGSSKINRGGAWDEPSEKCTSSFRGFDSPESSYDNMGFRVVLGADIQVRK